MNDFQVSFNGSMLLPQRNDSCQVTSQLICSQLDILSLDSVLCFAYISTVASYTKNESRSRDHFIQTRLIELWQQTFTLKLLQTLTATVFWVWKQLRFLWSINLIAYLINCRWEKQNLFHGTRTWPGVTFEHDNWNCNTMVTSRAEGITGLMRPAYLAKTCTASQAVSFFSLTFASCWRFSQ